MSSILGKDQGVYNNTLRFAFTNITEEDFTSAWDGNPITVKSGQTVELPHYLADKFTDELVNKIMIGAIKLEESQHPDPLYRSPRGSSLGVPAARKIWEDKIVRQLGVDEESPEIQVMRAEIKAEILNDLKKSESKQPITEALPKSIEDFADVTKKEPPKRKAPLRVKTIK